MTDTKEPNNGEAAERWQTFEVPPPADADVRERVVRIVLAMTPEQVATSSVTSGIHTPDGRLSSRYRGGQ